jgi:hypothetical protein
MFDLMDLNMKKLNVTGIWSGEYFYDPSEFDSEDFSGVPFDLDLKQSWFGRFRGYVQDKSEKGMLEPGVVRGKVINGYKISFIKRMPVMCVISATGVKSLSDYWLDKYSIQLDHIRASTYLLSRRILSRPKSSQWSVVCKRNYYQCSERGQTHRIICTNGFW